MAGLGKSFDDDDIISDINVTPLVDIALVLLIIFIVTSAIIVRAAINVELPRAASAGEELPDSFSIVVDRQGAIQFDGEPIEPGCGIFCRPDNVCCQFKYLLDGQ